MPIRPINPDKQRKTSDRKPQTSKPNSTGRVRKRPLPTARVPTDQSVSRGDKKCSDDYEVGYKKTPLETRFKKGQSGNPKGRPKGSKNLKTILKEVINEKVPVREDGKTRKITKLEAIIKQVVNKASTGDPRAIKQLMEFIREYLSEEQNADIGNAIAAAKSPAELDAEDEAILSAYQFTMSTEQSNGGD